MSYAAAQSSGSAAGSAAASTTVQSSGNTGTATTSSSSPKMSSDGLSSGYLTLISPARVYPETVVYFPIGGTMNFTWQFENIASYPESLVIQLGTTMDDGSGATSTVTFNATETPISGSSTSYIWDSSNYPPSIAQGTGYVIYIFDPSVGLQPSGGFQIGQLESFNSANLFTVSIFDPTMPCTPGLVCWCPQFYWNGCPSNGPSIGLYNSSTSGNVGEWVDLLFS